MKLALIVALLVGCAWGQDDICKLDPMPAVPKKGNFTIWEAPFKWGHLHNG